ncbi:MAG: hypothetical protein JO232_19110 [Verrucomicrobia bacterium]|nr:hypothetical protein [Verrucomicrobiota bacterium]
MKGSPLTRAIMTVVALLALLLPLQRLTSHQSATVSAPLPENSTAKQKLHLELVSTTVPFKFRVAHDGESVWSGESNSPTVSTDTELSFPPEGIDLVLDVSWSQDKETAVRLALTPQDSDTIAKTVWGTTSASEVLTFTQQK